MLFPRLLFTLRSPGTKISAAEKMDGDQVEPRICIIKPKWDFSGPQPPTHQCVVTDTSLSVEEYLAELVRQSPRYFEAFLHRWDDFDLLIIQAGETQHIHVHRYADKQVKTKKTIRLNLQEQSSAFFVANQPIYHLLTPGLERSSPQLKYALLFDEFGYSTGYLQKPTIHSIFLNEKRGESSRKRPHPEVEADEAGISGMDKKPKSQMEGSADNSTGEDIVEKNTTSNDEDQNDSENVLEGIDARHEDDKHVSFSDGVKQPLAGEEKEATDNLVAMDTSGEGNEEISAEQENLPEASTISRHTTNNETSTEHDDQNNQLPKDDTSDGTGVVTNAKETNPDHRIPKDDESDGIYIDSDDDIDPILPKAAEIKTVRSTDVFGDSDSENDVNESRDNVEDSGKSDPVEADAEEATSQKNNDDDDSSSSSSSTESSSSSSSTKSSSSSSSSSASSSSSSTESSSPSSSASKSTETLPVNRQLFPESLDSEENAVSGDTNLQVGEVPNEINMEMDGGYNENEDSQQSTTEVSEKISESADY